MNKLMKFQLTVFLTIILTMLSCGIFGEVETEITGEDETRVIGDNDTKPPNYGVFLMDGSTYIEIEGLEFPGLPYESSLGYSLTTPETTPWFTFWLPDISINNLQFFSASKREELRFDFESIGDGIYEVRPINSLEDGLYCFILGDPLASFVPAWCFRVGDPQIWNTPESENQGSTGPQLEFYINNIETQELETGFERVTIPLLVKNNTNKWMKVSISGSYDNPLKLTTEEGYDYLGERLLDLSGHTPLLPPGVVAIGEVLSFEIGNGSNPKTIHFNYKLWEATGPKDFNSAPVESIDFEITNALYDGPIPFDPTLLPNIYQTGQTIELNSVATIDIGNQYVDSGTWLSPKIPVRFTSLHKGYSIVTVYPTDYFLIDMQGNLFSIKGSIHRVEINPGASVETEIILCDYYWDYWNDSDKCNPYPPGKYYLISMVTIEEQSLDEVETRSFFISEFEIMPQNYNQESESSQNPESSPPPNVYPDVLGQTFSGVNVLYGDDFDFVIQGRSPQGWVVNTRDATQQSGLRETKDNNFRISAIENPEGGILFLYEGEVINPGEGVYFTFKYTGMEEVFTWGIDNIDAEGNLYQYKTEGYYSFAMQMENTTLSAHVIEGPYQEDDDFNGDLKLLEDNWYDFTLAFDKDDNFIIKIWEPNSPENQLVYVRNLPNSPNAYYFISWMGWQRTLWMDDFTIFSFDNFIQE